MVEIKLKRVYQEPEKTDGYRILVDRLWPRGLKKENLVYDLWEKNIAPSNELREWFHIDPDKRWNIFCEKYRDELDHSPYTEDFINNVKRTTITTLLFSAKDEKHTHAIILKSYLNDHLPHHS